MWAASTTVSLIVFGVIYFSVIKPATDTANQALKNGLQQTQQVISQATKQVTTAGQTNGAASQAVQKAAKLTSCLVSAGTDVTKIQACTTKYGH
jgi:hypothetical protein